MRFEGSLRVMHEQIISQFAVPTNPALADAAYELLHRWPLAAREAQAVWTGALGLIFVHGGGGAPLLALSKRRVTKLSDNVAEWRVRALVLAAAAADRLATSGSGHARDADLEKSLIAWRRSRTPAHAAVVETCGQRLVDAREPLARTKLQATWLAALAAEGLDGLSWIGPAFVDGKGTEIAARAAALCELADDPRIAAMGVRCLDNPVVGVGSSHVVWLAIGALLAIHADPRSLDAAGVLAKDNPEFGWVTELIKRRLPEPLHLVESPAVSKRASPTPRDHTPRTVSEWERWAMDEPADDTRREVFRDWLLERGDPRGELLSLQLSPSPKNAAREAALVKKHARNWVAPLGRYVCDRQPLRFVRGFAAELTVGGRALPDGDHPLWSAVSSLTFAYEEEARDEVVAFLCKPRLAGLRALRGLGSDLLSRILAKPPRTLEVLAGELPWEPDAPACVKRLVQAKLPNLVVLELTNAKVAHVQTILASPLGRRLRELVVDTREGAANLLDTKPPLERLTLFGGWEKSREFTLELTRDGKRWKLVASAQAPRHNPVNLRASHYESFIGERLRAIGRGRLSSVQLVVPKAFAPVGVDLANLGRATGTKIEVVTR